MRRVLSDRCEPDDDPARIDVERVVEFLALRSGRDSTRNSGSASEWRRRA
jgi:hypothetical protein